MALRCCWLFGILLLYLRSVKGEGRERYVTGIVNQSITLAPVPFKSMADWYFNGQHRDADNGTLVLSSDGQHQDYVHGDYQDQVQPGYNASLYLRVVKKKNEGWYKLVYDGDNLYTYLTVLDKGEEYITAEAKGLVSFSMPCRFSGRLLYHGADMHNNNPKEVLRCDNKSSPGHVTDMYQTRLVPSCNGSSDLTDLREEDGGLYTWECEGTTVCDIHLTVKGSHHSTPCAEINWRTWVLIGIIALLCIGGLLFTVLWKRKPKGAPCRRKQRTDSETYVEVRQNEDNLNLELSGKLSQPNGNTTFSEENSSKELIVDDTKRMETAEVLQDNITEAETNGVGGDNNIIKHLKEETWEPVTPSVCAGETYNLSCNTDNGPIGGGKSDIIRNNTINKDKREMDPGGEHVELRNVINNMYLSDTKSNSFNGIVEVYKYISDAAQNYINKIYHMDINDMDKRDRVTVGGTCTINMETDIDSDPVVYKGGEGQGHGDKPALDPDIDTNVLSNVNDNNLNPPFQSSRIDMYNPDGDIGKIMVDPGPFTKDFGYQQPSTGGNSPLHINIDNDD
ncbi:uncharacterized protein LOC108697567 isoform X2 [Xenopus laevis]|uniref:Uncharacterized protein n=2 Tax=Xenopus laevis TaxID=8355 RepID=A0A974I2N3_XENLA|nr:uncharacterized protein LOC108697567 isoform X2 [Xenopus laevis]OCT99140.1 hypothetical protein XELAEV_18004931mg [Xenopus laevis]